MEEKRDEHRILLFKVIAPEEDIDRIVKEIDDAVKEIAPDAIEVLLKGETTKNG